MPELFNRSYEVIVSLFGIPGFKFNSIIGDVPDIEFTVTRTMTREPNTADIKIFNLSPINRGKLEIIEEAQVELSAGYNGLNGLIFKGDCEIYNTHEFPDWITTFDADDGGKAIQLDRVNLSLPAGTTVMTAITSLAAQMRVGIGNAAAVAGLGTLVGGAGQAFLNGINMNGPASKQLDRLCKSSGLEWSIQNDALQLTLKDVPLPTTAVLLNKDTGMVGKPTISNKGILNVRSLMNKDIVPGGLVSVVSTSVTGLFRAEKCTYTGNNLGQDWYVDVEGKAI